MESKTTKYKLTKGQKITLDSIYAIQGIGGNDWWEYIDGDYNDDTNLLITRDILIEITVTK